MLESHGLQEKIVENFFFFFCLDVLLVPYMADMGIMAALNCKNIGSEMKSGLAAPAVWVTGCDWLEDFDYISRCNSSSLCCTTLLLWPDKWWGEAVHYRQCPITSRQ